MQKEILNNIGPSGAVAAVGSMQSRLLSNVLRKDRLERMIENEALNGSEAYKLTTMLSDLRKGLWSELSATKEIDTYRRNLQRAHVEMLAGLMKQDEKNRTDISAAARAELKTIQGMAKSASSRYPSGIVQYHLKDIDALIESKLSEE